MNAVIISIGDELILGQTVDTNAAWLSRELAALGVEVMEHITLGDDIGAIAASLERAGRQAGIIITTGGLGPTDDDLTRQALAQALGTRLELNPVALAHMQAYFERIGRPMVERNRIQAMIPQGAEMMENTCGTACGMIAPLGGALAFFTPGVPGEMRAMFSQAIVPRLENPRMSGLGERWFTRTIHTFGTGESQVAEMLGEMMVRGRNPLVNCTVSGGIVSLRINTRAKCPEEANRMSQSVDAEIHRRLGDLIFGYDQDTLAGVTGRMLRGKKATLAVAESCTGGGLARALTENSGASDYFLGGFLAYSNEAKIGLLGVDRTVLAQHGAVSEAVAQHMAERTRSLVGSDYALSITGIAGPGGGTPEKPVGLVFIGLADRVRTAVSRHIFSGDRAAVRQRSVHAALNGLRLTLLIR